MRRKATEEFIKEAGKALFTAEITRLLGEYGAVRLCKLEDDNVDYVDTLVVFSPVFCVPGDVQLPAACVLDSRLYKVGEAAYGSIKEAAREFGRKE